MITRKGVLGIGLCAALGYAALDWKEKNVEVVTLHASGGYSDYYPRLFIVDDPNDLSAAWVRAERPDRLWLAALRENPRVTVRRGAREFTYQAVVWSGDGGHQHVDEMFRAKYGWIDRAAAWFWERDAVPIHLEPEY